MNTTTTAQCWLTGMPDYPLSHVDRSVPGVLLGCRERARAILAATNDESTFKKRLDDEYCAVLEALLDAGMPFRILNLATADTPLAARLRSEGYPGFRLDVPGQGSTYTYPRDLMVYLVDHRIALISEDWLKPGVGDRAGVECWPTCWSEGGRVLFRDDTLVVFRHPEKSTAPDQTTLNRLRDRGLRVVEIPAGIFCALDQDGDLTGLFHDHHIDRAAGLIRGSDGALHLLLGPGYRTGPLDAPLNAPDSCDAVGRICDSAGLALHVIPDSDVPYATSTVQSPDGVVVISGGSGSLETILGTLVGPENVVPTRIPLTHFPTFASAGLHCLVTESPEFLLAPRDSDR